MKKIIGFLVTGCLAAGSIMAGMSGEILFCESGISYGAEEQSVEKAITLVKSVIKIPSDCSKFEFEVTDMKDGNKYVNLRWASEDDRKVINTVVINDKHILNADILEPKKAADYKDKKEMTSKEAEKYAKMYFDKFAPKPEELIKSGGKGEFKLLKSQIYPQSQSYRFNYRLYVNNVQSGLVSLEIEINKYTGDFERYVLYSDNLIAQTEYIDSTKAMDEAKAKKLFTEKIGPNLKYLSYYNEKTETLKVYPAYVMPHTDSCLNAVTGEVEKEVLVDGNADMMKEAGRDMTGEAVSDRFSAAETAGIEKAKNLLSKEKAEAILKSQVGINEKVDRASLKIMKNPDKTYAWFISYPNGEGAVDAKTGKILSYYMWDYDNQDRKGDIGKDKAKAEAEKWLEKLCGDIKDRIEQEGDIADAYDSYEISYERKEGEYKYTGNYVNINIDKATGNIKGFRRIWYDNISFPKVENVIGQEKALETYGKIAGFQLEYRQDAKGEVKLVYGFAGEMPVSLDAVTGKPLDYKGNEEKRRTGYTDISGHWAEKAIQGLLDMGLYLDGEEFKPNAQITQKEFLKYMYREKADWKETDEAFYGYMVETGIIKKEEINQNAAITKQEAIKFACRRMRLEKLASQSNLFKNVFKDKVDKEYVGYSAVAYGMGIATGNAKGEFAGKTRITRAEAANIIYKTVQAQ